MGVQIFFGNLQSNQRAAHWGLCEFEHSTQQLCALAHRYPANSVPFPLRYIESVPLHAICCRASC